MTTYRSLTPRRQKRPATTRSRSSPDPKRACCGLKTTRSSRGVCCPDGPGTFEDLRRRFLQSGGAEPEHFNLWGAAAREIVRQGILVRTGRHEKAKFVQNHARELPEYRRRDDDAPALFFCRGAGIDR